MAEARRWIGTPYQHQHSTLGAGCDCVGLILAVGRATGAMRIDQADWREFAGYSRTPNPTRMQLGMETFLEPILVTPGARPADGSICWMGWRSHLPMHLGLIATLAGRRTIIHAYAHAREVVEHTIGGPWPERILSWWRYPGAAET